MIKNALGVLAVLASLALAFAFAGAANAEEPRDRQTCARDCYDVHFEQCFDPIMEAIFNECVANDGFVEAAGEVHCLSMAAKRSALCMAFVNSCTEDCAAGRLRDGWRERAMRR